MRWHSSGPPRARHRARREWRRGPTETALARRWRRDCLTIRRLSRSASGPGWPGLTMGWVPNSSPSPFPRRSPRRGAGRGRSESADRCALPIDRTYLSISPRAGTLPGLQLPRNRGFAREKRDSSPISTGPPLRLVPTLRVGMPSSTLRVVRVAGADGGDAERPGRHPHAERGNGGGKGNGSRPAVTVKHGGDRRGVSKKGGQSRRADGLRHAHCKAAGPGDEEKSSAESTRGSWREDITEGHRKVRRGR